MKVWSGLLMWVEVATLGCGGSLDRIWGMCGVGLVFV